MKKGIFYDIPDKYKHSIAFTSKINPLVSTDKDKYLALASQDSFKKYLPKNIDFNEKIDFLGVCGEAFIANKLNLNDDGVQTAEALRIADLFPLSFIDANHSRKDIIGVIIQASFAEFGTGKELTREQVKDSKSPFSVILAGIVWRVANPELSEIIEASSDPSSQYNGKLFFSWELAFSENDLILIDAKKTNIEDGEIIKDPTKIIELEAKLRAYGGKGYDENGKKIGRLPIGDVIPIAVGIVLDPAGQVQPITSTVEKEESEEIDDLNATKNTDLNQNNQNSLSHSQNDNVKIDTIKTKYMKIKSFKELTEETLKECKAADLNELYDAEIQKINDAYVTKKNEHETAIKAANDKNAELAKKQEEIEKNLEKVTQDHTKLAEEHNKLVQANEQAKKVEIFSNRMQTLEEQFDLSEAEKNLLAEDVKLIDTDEAFAKFIEKQGILLAAKKKVFDPKTKKWVLPEDIKDKGADDNKEDKTGKVVKASVETAAVETVVDDALKNGVKEKATTANAGEAQELTLVEKAQKAFGIEGWTTDSKRKERNKE